MEDNNKFYSPSTKDLWASPMDIFPNPMRQERGNIIMSTPNTALWTPLSSSLEDSSSSRQDSGYSSVTPSSSTSFSDREFFDKNCPWCRTPSNSICSCNKNVPRKRSSNLEFMQPISEMHSSPSKLFLSRGAKTVCDFFDEAMDTSLYTDELEIESHPRECQGSLVDAMEIGEEKSIDFMDSNIYLSKNSAPDSTIIKESEISKDSEVAVAFNEGLSLFGCFSRSPKIIHQTTPTKLPKGGKFPSVASKVVKVNQVIKSFSLNGLEKIDLLYQLNGKRLNCPHIVSKIFSYLSDKDLDSVINVSKSWQELLSNDILNYNRWNIYKTRMMLWKENASSQTKEDSPAMQLRPEPLHIVNQNNHQRQRSNSSSNPCISPPVSPQSARFRSYQKAAKTLKKNERLLACPKCFFPSHDDGNPTTQCSRSGCRHRFCVWCRNEIITGIYHDCPPLYIPKYHRSASYKMSALGSKTYKRKMRRLTLDL